MPSVFLCSPTNSQMFTTCCSVAITERESKCPSCGEFIYPFRDESDLDEYTNHEVGRARWNLAYKR